MEQINTDYNQIDQSGNFQNDDEINQQIQIEQREVQNEINNAVNMVQKIQDVYNPTSQA